MKITYDERMIMKHTLGLNRSKVAYRNFFSANTDHEDIPTLDGLVEKSFMVRESSAISPDFIYRVTKVGKDALAEGGE